MQTDVYLIGTGQTRFGEWWGKSLKNLMGEAVDAAMEGAPCSALDIDFIVVANMLGETVSGQAHLGALASSFLPHRPPAIRVEAACASGSVALHTACALLESGRAETVLVVGAEKMTDAPTDAITTALMGAADGELDAPSGLTFPGIFGLIAERYMHEFGLTREQLNIVSSIHHRNGVSNPFAQFRQEIPAESIGASPLVASPLRLLDCSPVSDGAAACILSTKFPGKFRIAASQMSTDTVSITERPSITSFSATKDAVVRAFEEAGAEQNDIAHLELHDCFSIAALLALEDLGFAEPGRGIQWYEEGGSMTVNGSGGLKACGHPVAATGVKQLIDIKKQLTASGQRWGMTHNFGGAGATCAIHILEHAYA
ncbi:MAG: beta-ketoacyl synthase N-terminal-like domain-containing protein [Candidatus Peribacteraceae bacterium]|nr:beta-ketoacyl synthase N-terminal-like domain-containing protein [Candidatus Peribacteraceae bacterium]MDD5074390.1 beta-ketoacyl synthase N-terminal-like domain-containing protein [Candidatus Peribacteraceae bacterium]